MVISKLNCTNTQCYYLSFLSRGFTAPIGRSLNNKGLVSISLVSAFRWKKSSNCRMDWHYVVTVKSDGRLIISPR